VKKIFFLGLVVGLVLVSSSNVYANLIANPDFASGQTGWSFFSSGPTATGDIQSPGTGGSANYGEVTMNAQASSEPQYAGFYQVVNNPTTPNSVQPGKMLYLSGSVNGYNISAPGTMQGQLQIEFYNSYVIGDSSRIWGYDIDTTAVNSNQNWSSFAAAGYVPADAVTFQVVTLAVGFAQGETGTFGFDNINVDYSPVPEPASLLLLGSGLVGLFGVSRKKK
jgi:hypothetical protein